MKQKLLALADCATCAIGVGALADTDEGTRVIRENLHPFANQSGAAATFRAAGFIDVANPFFQSLGTNGRSCASCHQQGEGWTVTPEGVQKRFRASQGMDPIFRLNDGANSPAADVSTAAAKLQAYSMLLSKGLIRVGIGAILRGLASRAPYFHNGFAADFDAAVAFYNQRLGIGLTAQERADLKAFLRTLSRFDSHRSRRRCRVLIVAEAD